MKRGFDNSKYIDLQSQKIRDRISKFGDKLYLEFGGKLFDDFHASRVLPGFKPDSKLQMLLKLKDQAEIVIVINADAIEKNKRRGDLGITYDLDTLRNNVAVVLQKKQKDFSLFLTNFFFFFFFESKFAHKSIYFHPIIPVKILLLHHRRRSIQAQQGHNHLPYRQSQQG